MVEWFPVCNILKIFYTLSIYTTLHRCYTIIIFPTTTDRTVLPFTTSDSVFWLRCLFFQQISGGLVKINVCGGGGQISHTLHCHCILYTGYCTLHTLHFILYTLYFTLYTVHCILYTAYCTLHTVHCILYTG